MERQAATRNWMRMLILSGVKKMIQIVCGVFVASLTITGKVCIILVSKVFIYSNNLLELAMFESS